MFLEWEPDNRMLNNVNTRYKMRTGTVDYLERESFVMIKHRVCVWEGDSARGPTLGKYAYSHT